MKMQGIGICAINQYGEVLLFVDIDTKRGTEIGFYKTLVVDLKPEQDQKQLAYLELAKVFVDPQSCEFLASFENYNLITGDDETWHLYFTTIKRDDLKFTEEFKSRNDIKHSWFTQGMLEAKAEHASRAEFPTMEKFYNAVVGGLKKL